MERLLRYEKQKASSSITSNLFGYFDRIFLRVNDSEKLCKGWSCAVALCKKDLKNSKYACNRKTSFKVSSGNTTHQQRYVLSPEFSERKVLFPFYFVFDVDKMTCNVLSFIRTCLTLLFFFILNIEILE